MRFGVLGPLEVRAGGAALSLGTRKQQSVLALLAVNAGRVVSLDHLVDELWPTDPPASAVANVRGYAARLRRLLESVEPGRGRLLRRGFGYLLLADVQELDVLAFSVEVAAGRDELRQERPHQAIVHFGQALALWRGPMLAGVARGPQLAARCAAVEDERCAVTEELADAYLRLDEAGAAIALLREQVQSHPLRERGHLLLMRALYRLGDVAGALAAYAEARAALADQLGIEPGPELRELHRAVLNRDADAVAAPPAQANGDKAAPHNVGRPPALLPMDVYGFTGRDAELSRLDGALAAGREQPTAVVICVLSGTAGVGKTAAAVHWAHRVRPQFPDGQLYVNLRGFDPSDSPMPAGEALRGFLEALGIPQQRLPNGLEGQVGLYRSQLAGRRVLIVLDNARDAEQVRPLLPGSPGCLVVVTSRNQLTSLIAAEGAHPLTVDLLSVEEARELLTRRIGAERVAAEPVAADEIIAACARLPLALVVAAARAAAHTQLSLPALAGQLRDVRHGLDTLDGGDAATDVRAVFSWSYRALSPPAARLFRLFSLHPGPDLSVAAAASLAAVPQEHAAALLAELARAHLTTEPSLGRHGLHDLLRMYATRLADISDTEDDRRDTQRRVLDHYLHTANAAAMLLNPHRYPIALAPAEPGVTPEDLRDLGAAREWFTAEHAVLLAAVRQAAESGFPTHAWQLAWTLTNFHYRRAHWHDQEACQRIALDAAQRLADRPGQIHAHRGLAHAYTQLGRYDDAHAHYRDALARSREAGDGVAEADIHLNLGWLYERQNRRRQAMDYCRRALDLYRDAGHHTGQARALNAVGWHHANLGDPDRALKCCLQALELLQELGDRQGQAATWDSVGFAHHRLGQYQQAVASYRQAIDLLRDLGDRYHEADTLRHLGDTLQAAGDPQAARDAWQQALEVFKELGHPDAERLDAMLRDQREMVARASR